MDSKEYEDVCLICHRTESVTGKMFHIMNQMCICNDCMHKTLEGVGNLQYEDVLNHPMFQSMMQSYPADMENFGQMKTSSVQSNTSSTDGTSEILSEGEGVSQKNATAQGAEDKNTPATKAAEEIEEPAEAPEEDVNSPKGPSGMPRFSFINLADMQSALMGGPKIKKKKKGERKPIIDLKDIPAPHKIKEQLDAYVVGQEHAKKVMSVAVYNHYKRVATDTMDEIEIEKSNMLMIGPTGCGKTYLVRTLAKLLNVPLAITDATSLTEAGYIGDDIESVVSKLLAAADNDVDRAEQGIIFIDEIDKIAKKQNTNSRDVSGESVQQGMLKLLEGADIEVPIGASSKNAMVPTTTINTRNILFICGGAFPQLEDIIKQRLTKHSSMGFQGQLKDSLEKEKDILKQVTVEDIRKFGMIPEFVGRLPMIFTLDGLDQQMLVSILKEPKNALLKQYKKLLLLDEVKLEFEEDALEAIAEKAMERETGARALRAVIDQFMLDIMYEIPKDDNIGQVTITRAYIEGKGGPIVQMREN